MERLFLCIMTKYAKNMMKSAKNSQRFEIKVDLISALDKLDALKNMGGKNQLNNHSLSKSVIVQTL